MSIFDVFQDSTKQKPFFRRFDHDGGIYDESRKMHYDLLCQMGLDRAKGEVSSLPPGAFVAEIGFTLARPYVSRDETSYYPSQNPIVRDPVFKTPMVAGSSWKGALRAAATASFVEELSAKTYGSAAEAAGRRWQLCCLFGSEKGDWAHAYEIGLGNIEAYLEGACKGAYGTECTMLYAELVGRNPDLGEDPRREGRIHPLPTFFQAIGIDVLNPRNRKTRAGGGVIQMESVPAGTHGVLTLVWSPFDLVGKDQPEIQQEANRDWRVLAAAVKRTLLRSGFGAKKANSCGVAKEELTVGFNRAAALSAEWEGARPFPEVA